MKIAFALVASLAVVAPAQGAPLPLPGAAALPLVTGPDVPPATESAAIVPVFTDEEFDGCAGKVVATRLIDVPAGTWDRVILEFTGTPAGDPWDRLFSISIGGTEVLRGTTPRTEFTLRRDVTEYANLLPAGEKATVGLNFGTYVGKQLGTLRLELYANEPTAALVHARWNRIQPELNLASLNGAGKHVVKTVTFPEQAPASATVELTLSNHGAEEAQFANRVIHVLVDGKEIAFARPMPYVYAVAGFGGANANTACRGPGTSFEGDTLHPLMWWTAQQAADAAGVHGGVGEIPPYRAQVAAEDLARLTGTRTLDVWQQNGSPSWITSVTFLS